MKKKMKMLASRRTVLRIGEARIGGAAGRAFAGGRRREEGASPASPAPPPPPAAAATAREEEAEEGKSNHPHEMFASKWYHQTVKCEL